MRSRARHAIDIAVTLASAGALPFVHPAAITGNTVAWRLDG
ncbi:MAG: hypothetical protein AB7P03_29760 [Kofleriaceae bacterium]